MVMAHSLTPAAATAKTPISGGSARSGKASFSPRVWASHQIPHDRHHSTHRRTLTLGLSGALLLGLSSSASAAARRPPPPPPKEKRDPNVSGVQAKVLASKKRKEAMKEAIAKLRERGKPVQEQGQPQPQPPPDQ
ncbi:hypothetical protein L6164_023924 [Bauhinia variegata]|uniref:Uncharacterized protein n=1 Tax=Bauhinia variegata TaxID=167791 RepID=A0ACB9MLU7_BAUVA|nr:hypothetical protein L6164_023924 [Bauhinia variegata]